MGKTLLLFTLILTPGLTMFGCDGATDQKVAVHLSSGDVNGRLRSTLMAYDALQEAFANDDFDRANQMVDRIEGAATAAQQSSSETISGQLQRMATSANNIKNAKNPTGMRRHFGQMSKAVMTIISEHPTLQSGRYAFKCPMAKGYQKWVQVTPLLQNPYYGAEMLNCGVSTSWSP